MKRLFDVTASFLGLIVLSPLLAVVALLIKTTSRGSVIFRQERAGRNFRPFTIYKFRTMVVGAHEMGPGVAGDEDPRITSFGRILRKTKIDELPQLFNVLRGDMSLVGPRPELPEYVNRFRTEYAEVLTVRPGITDPASITYRDEGNLHNQSKDPEDQYLHVILPEKLRLAREYVHRSSFFYDIRLIVATIVSLAYPGKSLDRFLNSMAPHRFPIAAIVQSTLIVLANYLAFLIRFEGRIPGPELHLFFTTVPILLVVRLVFFYPFRLYRGLWRYVSILDLQSIAASVTLSSGAWWLFSKFIPGFSSYPLSVLILDWLLCLMFLGGARLVRRIHSGVGQDGPSRRSVLIVGSGDSTERILRWTLTTAQGEYRVVGLIDNDPDHKGASIHNVPVMGTLQDLERVIRREDPEEILIALPASQIDERKEVIRKCKKLDKPAKVIPDLLDLVAGRKPVGMPDIEADDLLFREPIRSDFAALSSFYAAKRIMITGAGGSIGSEISRQAAACLPELLVLFEKHEGSLYMIDKELRSLHPDLKIETIIGDVTDKERVREVMRKTTPQMVFHAAAYKHVPMMERNPSEALKTNVFGTNIVSELAGEFRAEAFVLISTDKAVEPIGVMGRSKRMAELVLQELNGSNRTRYMTVRFGNVLESSGSVIPLFREQIERGGPITITHPEITRLFMTIPEAVQLILQAGSMGKGGEIFVLDMGKPIRILDLAKALIRLYGLSPGKDIEIVFTGLRPGERLFEKLVNDREKVWKTPHSKILMAVGECSERKAREEFIEHIAAIESAMEGQGTRELFESAKNLLA